MSTIYAQLLSRAQRIAEIYGQNSKAHAVVVVGSIARKQCDEYSDVDMTVFYEAMPTEEEVRSGRDALQAREWRRFPGAEVDVFADSFLLDGVECQVGHCLISRIERDINAVVQHYATEHDLHVIMGSIQDALPLYGTDLVTTWQQQCANYSDELAKAMVQAHLQFRPLWVLEQRLMRRDAPLLLHQFIIEEEYKILSALFGLNRLYPELHFKRLDAYIARMPIVPTQLSRRLQQILHQEPRLALALFQELVWELFDLVEQHVPELDITQARQKFAQPPRKLHLSS
jgi:predicted nucleotidyltransferase